MAHQFGEKDVWTAGAMPLASWIALVGTDPMTFPFIPKLMNFTTSFLSLSGKFKVPSLYR